jgi:DNA-binding transcriptional MerR regulator
MTQTAPSDVELSIRDIAAKFDVTPRTLRFYEQKGLLNPKRRGGSRWYTAADVARLSLILRGRRVGFSLEEIGEMLDLEALAARSHVTLSRNLKRFRERITVLEQQRNDIEDALAELNAGCAWLEERLADREPSEDIKRRAAAFEALASARLTQWSGHAPDDPI